MRLRLTALAIALAGMTMAFTVAAQAALTVTWMPGVTSPGTPARLDRVGVIKVGPAHARNVLVIEPGTSAGGAYFVPVARWIVSRATGWQVWSVERRENRLEDQSELDLAKRGGATATQVFDYYLGWIRDPSLTPHVTGLPAASYAKRWGMAVAVGDVHRVITAARRLGGKVMLGGHSLGGGGVTAYATWSFAGRPGADQLTGLVYIDGGSEWYFPLRLSIDLAAVGNGAASGAQHALHLRSTLGRELPRSLRIYAFGARLGGRTILDEAVTLARQSRIPRSG